MLFTWNHSDDRKERNGKRQKKIVRKKESSLEAFGDENRLGTTGRKTIVMRQC